MLNKFERCFCNMSKYKHVENKGSFYTERNGVKLTIYFEKSNGLVDWLNNFDFEPDTIFTNPVATKQTAKSKFKNLIGWIKGFIFNVIIPKRAYKDSAVKWRCHGGFLKVWKAIEPYLREDIHNPLIKEFEIVGYSHGGAIAQLCHEYIKYWRSDAKVEGYGFGAPRVIWGTPDEALLKRFEGFTIIRNGNDIVTHLPPKIFGFKDVCKIITLDHYPANQGPIKDHYPVSYWVSLYSAEGKNAAV